MKKCHFSFFQVQDFSLKVFPNRLIQRNYSINYSRISRNMYLYPDLRSPTIANWNEKFKNWRWGYFRLFPPNDIFLMISSRLYLGSLDWGLRKNPGTSTRLFLIYYAVIILSPPQKRNFLEHEIYFKISVTQHPKKCFLDFLKSCKLHFS